MGDNSKKLCSCQLCLYNTHNVDLHMFGPIIAALQNLTARVSVGKKIKEN